MAGQSPDRRKVLEILAKAAVAAQYPGFSRWAFAGEHHHEAAPQVTPKPARYMPQFFNPSEYRTIEILTEMIIPADETPGAKEAGVSEFIDFMAAHGDENVRAPMRTGLDWLDKHAEKENGSAFADLTPADARNILQTISSTKSSTGKQGNLFFKLIRTYTVMGYYTSRIGLQELDYPGLAFYTQSPECPHKDDPTHQHLPPPKF